MVMLPLDLVPNRTPTLQLYQRDTDTTVGSTITGIVDDEVTSLYRFDLDGVAVGDYDGQVAGVSVVLGSRIKIRLESDTVTVGDTWGEVDDQTGEVGPYRTTEEAVKRIISYDQVLIPDIEPFIGDAYEIVTEIIGFDDRAPAAILEMVERYLSAHFIAITDPRLQSEQVKSLLASYQNKLSPGLGITHFGTIAMTMDTTGRLARWNAQMISGGGAKQLFWAGTTV